MKPLYIPLASGEYKITPVSPRLALSLLDSTTIPVFISITYGVIATLTTLL